MDYQRAWLLLIDRIQPKTSWGRNELRDLMLRCLVDAGNPKGLTLTAGPWEPIPPCEYCGMDIDNPAYDSGCPEDPDGLLRHNHRG